MRYKSLLFLIVIELIYGNMLAQRSSVNYDSIQIVRQKRYIAYLDTAYKNSANERKAFLSFLKTIPSDSAFALDLRGMNFREFPDIIRFTNITSINIEHNQIKFIKLKSRNLKNVTNINISRNQLLKAKIGRAPKLLTFNMDYNKIRKIPKGIFWVKQIRAINFRSCNVEKLPWWLKYRKRINKIYAFNNPIPMSRRNVRRMRNITHLQISIMSDDSVPDYFSKLVKLKKLVFYNSKIDKLPSNFWKLSNLEVFILYKDNFTEIPEVCFKLPNLRHLDFYYNRIRFIPMGIIKCDSLEELFLSFNQISIIPDAMQSMKNLRKFYIHHNNIEEIPNWINSLTNLEIFDIGYNDISKLPNLSNLKKLESLDIQSNKIQDFPFDYLNLPSLKTIFLSNNPFKINSLDLKKINIQKAIFEKSGGKIIMDSFE